MSKISDTIERIAITAEADDAGEGIFIRRSTPISNHLAGERIREYARRRGMTLYDIAQALYWPSDANEKATQRNIVAIVRRAEGY